jgi:amino acid permease
VIWPDFTDSSQSPLGSGCRRTDGRLTRALGTRDLAVYYLSSLVGVGALVVPGIALAKAGPTSLDALGRPA